MRITHPEWVSASGGDGAQDEDKAFVAKEKEYACTAWLVGAGARGARIVPSACSASPRRARRALSTKKIVGVRYKCYFCRPDVNLCSACAESDLAHEWSHPLIMVAETSWPDQGAACDAPRRSSERSSARTQELWLSSVESGTT